MRINAPGGGSNATNTALSGTQGDFITALSRNHYFFDFDHMDDSNVFTGLKVQRLKAVETGGGIKRFSIPFPSLGIITEISNNWNLDLDASTINLTTHVGGRIDGIALEASRAYLIWGFLDANQQFAGFGLTRKPYSTFTTAGVGLKGASPILTVTNGFQFSVGARVVVRNNIGATPNFEWNGGTITAVTNTTITVFLDNNAHGTNLSVTGGGSGGVVQQWDTFRPWVVTSTGQTLYKTSYSLLGEMYTDSGSSIVSRHRVDEEWRCVEPNANSPVDQAANQATPLAASIGRWAPMWADMADFQLLVQHTAAGGTLNLHSQCGGTYTMLTQVANQILTHYIPRYGLFPRGEIVWSGSAVSNKQIRIMGYWVCGGMHR